MLKSATSSGRFVTLAMNGPGSFCIWRVDTTGRGWVEKKFQTIILQCFPFPLDSFCNEMLNWILHFHFLYQNICYDLSSPRTIQKVTFTHWYCGWFFWFSDIWTITKCWTCNFQIWTAPILKLSWRLLIIQCAWLWRFSSSDNGIFVFYGFSHFCSF